MIAELAVSLAFSAFASEAIGRPCPAAPNDVHARVDELQCVAGWLERNADLGRSKNGTERAAYDKERRRAKALLKKIDGWLSSAEDRSRPVVSEDAKRRAQQHYLSGIIFFQKGDYDKARDEWRSARELDPTNGDAKAGLERIAMLYGK